MDKKKKIFLDAYDSYADAIYRHCFFRVWRKERAEELVQETFMRAWQYLEKNEPVGNIRALLYRIATNLIIDDSRRRKEDSLDVILAASDGNEPMYDGGRDMKNQVLWKEVLEEMKELDDDEREILTMRYVDDLDPKNIAEVLDISPNNVSVKINRAVKKLKTKF